jgi:hypothetical protein
MTASLTRRDLLLAGVAAAIVAAGAGGFSATLYAQSDITPDQFVKLSETLTQQTGLDADIAKTLLGGFLATGNGPALAALVANPTSNADVANAIVAAWYSGLYNAGKGQAVAAFTDALVWTALTFTKPWGECGGETGYWADPPPS